MAGRARMDDLLVAQTSLNAEVARLSDRVSQLLTRLEGAEEMLKSRPPPQPAAAATAPKVQAQAASTKAAAAPASGAAKMTPAAEQQLPAPMDGVSAGVPVGFGKHERVWHLPTAGVRRDRPQRVPT